MRCGRLTTVSVVHAGLRSGVQSQQHLRSFSSDSSTASISPLLRESSFINGKWVTASTSNGHSGNAMIKVHNPATGEYIGSVPNCGVAETRQAIESANTAFKTFRRTTAAERGGILRRLSALMAENRDELAAIITAENGKPIAEAKGEVAYSMSFLDWFAAEGERMYGDVIPSPVPTRRLVVQREPIGVVGAITPWNFPSAMLARKVAAAIAAGCTIVAKPSEFTPFSALAINELAQKAGLPDGVWSTVTGDALSIGGELTSNSTVRKITFTGSTRVGKLLMEQSAATVKRMSMELGGNAPFIVFEDANIEKAVEGTIASKFRNCGQTCVSANRIFVHESVLDQYVAALKTRISTLKVGVGTEPGVDLGPLINNAAVEKVERLVADATGKGAQLLAGGSRVSELPNGSFFQPTIVANVNQSMDLAHEEVFGPVATIVPFSTDAQVVEAANDTHAGLAAYFYTENIARAWKVAEDLEYGMVGINEPVISLSVTPFGGVKQSGMGREGSKYGLDDYTNLKYMCFGGIQ
jgi:succinate-semialdehyde dehydrogenase / glutarate-semialdehyde dehydrogenase